ncbi:hypothetical protein SK128_015859 [Halocaridina rubra]|uniref:Uncharacterized protein n=1 Tax=Halocaridina rubra TaxID=373956 RepID=A0AAN8ZXD4_HALRR
MDIVVVDRRVIGRVLDVVVLRGASGGISDQYVMESRVIVGEKWRRRRSERGREVVKASDPIKKKGDCENKANLRNVWNVVKEEVEEEVEEEWSCFNEEVMKCAEAVCERRLTRRSKRKGSEWWNEENRHDFNGVGRMHLLTPTLPIYPVLGPALLSQRLA